MYLRLIWSKHLCAACPSLQHQFQTVVVQHNQTFSLQSNVKSNIAYRSLYAPSMTSCMSSSSRTFFRGREPISSNASFWNNKKPFDKNDKDIQRLLEIIKTWSSHTPASSESSEVGDLQTHKFDMPITQWKSEEKEKVKSEKQAKTLKSDVNENNNLIKSDGNENNCLIKSDGNENNSIISNTDLLNFMDNTVVEKKYSTVDESDGQNLATPNNERTCQTDTTQELRGEPINSNVSNLLKLLAQTESQHDIEEKTRKFLSTVAVSGNNDNKASAIPDLDENSLNPEVPASQSELSAINNDGEHSLLKETKNLTGANNTSKCLLNKLAHKKRHFSPPVYITKCTEGGFVSVVVFNNIHYKGTGVCKSRKAAEQNAAQVVLNAEAGIMDNAQSVKVPSAVSVAAKNRLQEYCQKVKKLFPTYETKQIEGSNNFISTVTVDNKSYTGQEANCKKMAEHSAAEVGLISLGIH